MDPLSEVLALLKPQSYSSGGFAINGDTSISFPKHPGIKCYAMLAGQCYLVVDTIPDPVMLQAGDCFLLPRGLPFCLTTNLALEPVHYSVVLARASMRTDSAVIADHTHYMAGGHFAFAGSHASLLLHSLPPIVHIRREEDKANMRWLLERMREEISNPQPGGSLITQQLACMMLIQALRLHLNNGECAGAGWLSALADKHMSVAIAAMHNDPGRSWTLKALAQRTGLSRSVFALRFREIVGTTPMEYLTRWRMMLAADRLQSSDEGLAAISQSLGYESESAFGKAFRRIMGCSPRQYVRPQRAVPSPQNV